MKKLILLILAFSLFVVSNGISQTYNMANGNDTTCSGIFYDNGGLGLYGLNQNITQTFYPGAPGSVVSLNFTTFSLNAAHNLTVREGGPTGTIIGVYSGTSLAGVTITSSAPDGSLTFTFNSTTTANAQNGWVANISCKFSCQNFIAITDSTFPIADTNNEIKICVGTPINMIGNASFPNSGSYYNQSIATSTFTWKTGDGFTLPGRNVTHTFNTAGIFDLNLVVQDTIGCEIIKKGARVIVAQPPNFKNIKYFEDDTICFGDTAVITIPDSGLFSPFTPPTLNAAGITFLPDGNGVSYTDTIAVSIFSPLATFGAGYLESIYVNMEHSYLGDLEIRVTCPSGNSAILKQAAGGLNTHLGEPVDPAFTTPLNPGIGYTYEFTNRSPFYGTMVNESGTYQHNYTDVLGNAYVNADYLPAGTYTPFQNLSTQLNGCPLNGNWVITVTDNIAIDNGYIFFWGLNFDSLIRPPSAVSSILGTRDSSVWTSTSNIISSTSTPSISTSPLTSGTHSYNYKIYDNFGCTHDTTVFLYVKNKIKSNAGLDFTTCRLDYQLSPIPSVNNDNSSWSYYSNSATGVSTIADTALYTSNTVVNEFSTFNYILNEIVEGCETYPDTVVITHNAVINTIDIAVSKDTICLPELVTFTNNSDMSLFDSIYWAFGDGTNSNSQGASTHNYTTASCYDLTVTLVNSLGCKIDSVIEEIVCAYPTPVANFNYTPFEPIVPETNVTFNNISSGATSYFWDFAGLGNSTLENDNFEFPKTDAGAYPVTLTVSNEGGCTDQITHTVVIKNPLSIYIPNAFTPNEDGLNDVFKVIFNNDAITDYSISVYNRWGELMFYSEDINFEWDGTLKGEKVPVGVYVWRINGREEFSTQSFSKIGHITITR